MNVHILASPKSPAHYYCQSCQRGVHLAQGPLCGACGYSYDAFKSKGLLGCEHCYSAFAPRLEPLMRDYQGHLPGLRPYTESPPWDSVARARTEELQELLFSSKSILEVGLPGKPSSDKTQKNSASFGHGLPSNLPTELIWPELAKGFAQTSKSLKKARGKGEIRVRLRIARNIAGVPFFHRLDLDQQRRLDHLLRARTSPIPIYLQEWMARRKCDYTQTYHFVVGEEDHFRIVGLFENSVEDFLSEKGKSESEKKTASLLQVLQALSSLYETAWHPDYGYLTACPAISGEGVRLSVELFLPRLSAKQADWFLDLKKSGFEVRSPGLERYNYTKKLQISLRAWPYGSSNSIQIQKLFGLVAQLLSWEQNM